MNDEAWVRQMKNAEELDLEEMFEGSFRSELYNLIAEVRCPNHG